MCHVLICKSKHLWDYLLIPLIVHCFIPGKIEAGKLNTGDALYWLINKNGVCAVTIENLIQAFSGICWDLISRDEFRHVRILVWSLLSFLARKLALHPTNHRWPRHSAAHNYMYARGKHTCSCRAGNASVTYDWRCAVPASWWESSGSFRLGSKHMWAHPCS